MTVNDFVTLICIDLAYAKDVRFNKLTYLPTLSNILCYWLALIHGWRVTTSWVRHPLWINQLGQLSLPSLRGR